MKTIRSLLATVVLAIGFAALGCAGVDGIESPDSGTVHIALTQGPSGVGCLAITAQGTRTLMRTFDLTAGANTQIKMEGLPPGVVDLTLTAGANAQIKMEGLPPGVVNFTGNAFETPCTLLGGSAEPGWISDVSTAVIVPGAEAGVTLVMRRNGDDVGASGAKDQPQPSVYEPFGSTTGMPARGEDGGLGFSAPWMAGGFNATVHDNFVLGSGSLVYPGLAVSGGHVSSISQANISGVSRALAQPLGQPGTTRYLSLLLQPEGALDARVSDGFFGMVLGSSSYDLFVGAPDGGQLGSYAMQDLGGGGPVASTSAPVLGQVTLVVLKAEFGDPADPAGVDRLTLYVNPQVGAPEPAIGVVKQVAAFGEFDSISLYATGAFSLDEIRIGDTFASVTPGAL